MLHIWQTKKKYALSNQFTKQNNFVDNFMCVYIYKSIFAQNLELRMCMSTFLQY